VPVRAIPVTNASPIFIFAATMPIERLKNKDQETQLDSCTDQSGCRRYIATASSARDWGLGKRLVRTKKNIWQMVEDRPLNWVF